MSRFRTGIFEGNPIRARPVGWRKFIPGYTNWSPPYLGGTLVEFDLELTEQDTSVRLFNLPFYAVNTASKNKDRIQFDSSKQEKKTTIKRYSAPSEGTLQVWVGEPESEGSVLMVQADTWNLTNLVIAVITAIIVYFLREILEWLF